MEVVKIGRYELFSLLGRGSIGIVYRARDTKLKRTVAIKILKHIFNEKSSKNNSIRENFERECLVASALCHPHIVTVLDAGHTDFGLPYIVMELVQGASLESLLNQGSGIEPALTLKYLRQLASAIDYAHEQGVLHRDIKPSNIIIDQFDNAHLLDFSTAKYINTSTTLAGTLFGTPGYISPEILNQNTIDHRSDLFSFAVLAYEMLNGSSPFPGTGIMSSVNAVLKAAPISVTLCNRSLSHKLDVVFQKALATNPKDRFCDAAHFIRELRRGLGIAPQDAVFLETLFDNSAPRDPHTPPHILGAKRKGSFGRKGKSLGIFLDKYLRSHMREHSQLNQDIRTAEKIMETKQKTLLQRWRQSLGSEKIYSNVPTQILVAMFLIAGVLPFSNSWLGTSSTTTAFASTHRSDLSELTARGQLLSQRSYIDNNKLKTRLNDSPTRILSYVRSNSRNSNTPAITKKIFEYTKSPDFTVRNAAIANLPNLAKLDHKKAAIILLDSLNDRDRIVRAHAARALAHLGGANAHALLKSRIALEPDPLVQRVIRYSLNRYADGNNIETKELLD